MGQDMMIFIAIGFILIVVGIAFMFNKRKPADKIEVTKDGTKDSKPAEVKKIKRVEKPVDQHDMSAFIKFDKIANDMIYQNNGERYTMVIQCKGVNYHLMSELEQMSVEEGFIMFLNTLKFPIQLYVQTRSVDLSENVRTYKERVKGFVEKQNEVAAKCSEVEDDIDSTHEEVAYMRKEKLKYTNIAEYVSDITRYVERMALNKHMLQRSFYIVFSYNKNELATTEKFTKEEYEDLCYRELYTRAQAIMGSLTTCSVTGRVLTSNELAQLVYSSLNKDDSALMNIKEALDAGMFSLYTSSEDILKKKREMLDAELDREGKQRVEEVVKQAMAKGLIVTEAESEEAVQKEIDRRALKIIEQSEADSKIKETLKDVIKDNRRERVEKLNKALGRDVTKDKQTTVMEEKILTANDIFKTEDADDKKEQEETTATEEVVSTEAKTEINEQVIENVEISSDNELLVEEKIESPVEVAQEQATQSVNEEQVTPPPFSPLAGMEDLLDDDMIIGTKEGENTNEGE